VNSSSRYYEILQIVPSASLEDIRQAYVDLVRVWHPDRFATDPRLQKIAEERLKDITEAYEALSSPQAALEGVLPGPSAPSVQSTKATGRWDLKAWLIVFGSAGLLLVLVVTVAQAIIMLTTPYRDALLMKSEANRLAGLFGPDPALEQSLPPSPELKRISKHIESPSPGPGMRPPNGADLMPVRGGNGLGEIHVRNDSDLDCVLNVTERNAPGATLRLIYVQGQREASIAGLEPGIYRVRVNFGQKWDGEALSFAQREAHEYWIGPFQFFETENSAERRGLRYNVGLRPPAL
jgi:hypothetical protein